MGKDDVVDMEYYSGRKRMKNAICSKAWVDLEIVILNRSDRTETDSQT